MRPTRHRRHLVFGAATMLTILAVVAGAVFTSGAEAGTRAGNSLAASTTTVTPKLDWSDCGDGLQCTNARVPLDYDKPLGRKIALAVIRRPATDHKHRIGSLFVNNGGPGNSVLDFVRGDATQVLSSEVQARFDVIGFDPRGVGQSTPVQCFANLDQQGAFFGSRPALPVSADEVRAFTKGSSAIGRLCRKHNGDLLDHLSTAGDDLSDDIGDPTRRPVQTR